MKLNASLYLALLVFPLTACGFSQPEPTPGISDINVSGGDTTAIKATYPYSRVVFIAVKTESKPTSAKLFAGSKTFQAGNGLSDYWWAVRLDACKDLPQGKNILIRFDQYDAAGQVLISQQTTLSSVDAC